MTIDWSQKHSRPDPLVERRKRMIVRRYQAKAVLQKAGLFGRAKAAVASADEQTKLAFEEKHEWQRLSPLLAAMQAALKLTDEEVDALFEAAAQVEE